MNNQEIKNIVSDLLDIVHQNTETNDLHEINSTKCVEAIEEYIENMWHQKIIN